MSERNLRATTHTAAAHTVQLRRVVTQLAQAARELGSTSTTSAYRLVVLRRVDRLLDEYLTLERGLHG